MKKIFLIIILVIVSYGSTYAQSDDENLYDEYMRLRFQKFNHVKFDPEGENYVKGRLYMYSGLLVNVDYDGTGRKFENLRKIKLQDVTDIYYFVDPDVTKQNHPLDFTPFNKGFIFMFTKDFKSHRFIENESKAKVIETLKKWGFKRWEITKPDPFEELKP